VAVSPEARAANADRVYPCEITAESRELLLRI